jgi:hypothetical protein
VGIAVQNEVEDRNASETAFLEGLIEGSMTMQ